MGDGLVRQIGEQAKRRAVAHPPVGCQQAVVARVRLAEGGARQPRDNLPPADREQVPHQRQPFRAAGASRSSQSSTADSQVEGRSGSGTSSPYFA